MSFRILKSNRKLHSFQINILYISIYLPIIKEWFVPLLSYQNPAYTFLDKMISAFHIVRGKEIFICFLAENNLIFQMKAQKIESEPILIKN